MAVEPANTQIDKYSVRDSRCVQMFKPQSRIEF